MMYYLESPSVDARFNLALEQYLFEALPQSHSFFMLWRNERSVIVGKHQNTEEEINEAFVRDHGIRVVRRLSGGGAVYHDLGNVNFTFITDRREGEESFQFGPFCAPVLRLLRGAGVPAERTGRNDLVIGGRKFSGNSQYVKKGRLLHHGTILYDSDLEVMGRALRSSAEKLRGKGVSSVPARVVNVRPYMKEELSTEQFLERFRQFLFREYSLKEYELSEADWARVKEIQRQVYDRWEWNYGASPMYDIRKKWYVDGCGTVEAFVETEGGDVLSEDTPAGNITSENVLPGGCIRRIRFYGDYFGERDTAELEKLLAGCLLDRKAVAERVQTVNLAEYFKGMGERAFLDGLFGSGSLLGSRK